MWALRGRNASLVDNISRTCPKYAISSSLLRLRATPSISNSTGPAALAYTPCGRAPSARHGTMATATALYAYYTFVTAVDSHEVYLRRSQSPAAAITSRPRSSYILTTAWLSTSLFSTCTPRGPRTRASEYTHKGKEKRNKLTVHFCKLLNIQFTLSLQLA